MRSSLWLAPPAVMGMGTPGARRDRHTTPGVLFQAKVPECDKHTGNAHLQAMIGSWKLGFYGKRNTRKAI